MDSHAGGRPLAGVGVCGGGARCGARCTRPVALVVHGELQGRRRQHLRHCVLRALLQGAWRGKEGEDGGRQELLSCTSEDGVPETGEPLGGGEVREDDRADDVEEGR